VVGRVTRPDGFFCTTATGGRDLCVGSVDPTYGLSLSFKPRGGRRHVATGGAQPAAWRAERNPWEKGVGDGPAPRGAEEPPSPGRGEKERIGRKERIGDPLLAHGFRVGPLRGRAAPPAATIPGPVGAEHDPAFRPSPRSPVPPLPAFAVYCALRTPPSPPERPGGYGGQVRTRKCRSPRPLRSLL